MIRTITKKLKEHELHIQIQFTLRRKPYEQRNIYQQHTFFYSKVKTMEKHLATYIPRHTPLRHGTMISVWRTIRTKVYKDTASGAYQAFFYQS
jgi:hypothetical protein